MSGNSLDIIHHSRHIWENIMVLTLEDVIRMTFSSLYNECIIDESRSEGIN